MAQRGFNVGVFRSEVARKGGVLRANRFLVVFSLPPGLRGTAGADIHTDTVRTLEYWCEGAHLPAHHLTTYGIQRYGYGAAETRVTGLVPRQMQVQFREAADASVQKLFNRWLNLIYNIDMSEGPNEATGEVNSGGALGAANNRRYQPYELTFREEYVTDVHLQIYDVTGDLVRAITYRDAYPVHITDVNMHWNNNNTYFTLPVTFVYTDFYDQPIT